jgi:hypothetical protein
MKRGAVVPFRPPALDAAILALTEAVRAIDLKLSGVTQQLDMLRQDIAPFVQATAHRHGPRDDAEARVIRELLAAFGCDEWFTARQVDDCARRSAPRLAETIVDADVIGTHGLGLLLTRLTGSVVDGVWLECERDTRRNVNCWRLRRGSTGGNLRTSAP